MKLALTSDERDDVRGCSVVIAPDRHPGRSSWNAQRPRLSTRTGQPRQSRKAATIEPSAPIQYVAGAQYDADDGTRTTYKFRYYATVGELAIVLTVDGVEPSHAREIIEAYRKYLDYHPTIKTIDIHHGAGRGW